MVAILVNIARYNEILGDLEFSHTTRRLKIEAQNQKMIFLQNSSLELVTVETKD